MLMRGSNDALLTRKPSFRSRRVLRSCAGHCGGACRRSRHPRRASGACAPTAGRRARLQQKPFFEFGIRYFILAIFTRVAKHVVQAEGVQTLFAHQSAKCSKSYQIPGKRIQIVGRIVKEVKVWLCRHGRQIPTWPRSAGDNPMPPAKDRPVLRRQAAGLPAGLSQSQKAIASPNVTCPTGIASDVGLPHGVRPVQPGRCTTTPYRPNPTAAALLDFGLVLLGLDKSPELSQGDLRGTAIKRFC